MALTPSAEFNVNIRVPELDTSTLIGSRPTRADHIFEFIAKYANGTGASKIGAAYSARLSLSSAQNIDLSSSLTTWDGSTVSFPILMGVFVKNLSTTSGETAQIGGGSDGAGTAAVINWVAAAADIVNVGPSGFFALWDPIDGYAVTNSTADILRIEAAAGSPNVDVLIVGRAS